MNPAPVVIGPENRRHRNVILEFLAVGVRQPRVPPHAHPGGEIRPLNKAGGDMLRIGIADARRNFDADALRRGVFAFRALIRAVQLHQLGEINLAIELVNHRAPIGVEAVCGDLYAIL